jgi:hypothetical protein
MWFGQYVVEILSAAQLRRGVHELWYLEFTLCAKVTLCAWTSVRACKATADDVIHPSAAVTELKRTICHTHNSVF